MKKLHLTNRTIRVTLVCCLLSFQFFSCKKFLDVQPRDYMFEEEAFSTKKGVEAALNGLYQSLPDSMLYGKTLTIGGTEQFAQYFYPIAGEHQNLFKDYNMTAVRSLFSQVWSKSYRTILGANVFCSKLENPSFNVVEPVEKKILLGEAYAIRAFLHFDMLRIFGPVYAASPGNTAIPYITKPAIEAQPLLSATAAIDKILEDLDAAVKLLEKDPVRTKGADRSGMPADGQVMDYLSNRHRRMNYYAVRTLQARVLLYAGKKELAGTAAQSIIAEQEAFFPWQTEQQMASDPLLSKETFFGIDNRSLYDYYRRMFSPLVHDEMIYTPTQEKLDAMYDPASTDLRLRYWFKTGVEGNKNYKVFVKHSNANITDATFRYYQPLIKKAELYLIAAETAPDLQQGYFYLNSLRLSRGLTPVNYQPASTSADLLLEIRKEYEREFIGEGQTYFMFKRLNLGTITSYTGTSTVTMDAGKYVVPLPEDETYYRQ
ncbi:RagB/SusD family nutrient uptake outer membrane protein [Pseudobacter ginsenosidimutans]|uniref:SusD-like starch-binding protein associating with outer membrane n=1 Tax=Pseudobacter ginsenosidimutans TaxID=661488 RepID=A0A4Q7MLY7_9BACT|nr:RagB/SusD family nutrient uptake outer membrane protein [Pseudobacter ginsenosidimutans]QEC45698.1 RagB/SusD family nutrient uptake outer membrane protein [Pseudobacter ginsenosidimutans]RZS69364.1 SusD-like starch-binding protein associating with outer membrane [Pseudobacter ginsenosidimutans]